MSWLLRLCVLWGWAEYSSSMLCERVKQPRHATNDPSHHANAHIRQVCLVTNPIWLVKTRMALQQRAPAAGIVPYKGLMDALVRIGKEEGIKGYYKGIGPSLLLQVGSVVRAVAACSGCIIYGLPAKRGAAARPRHLVDHATLESAASPSTHNTYHPSTLQSTPPDHPRRDPVCGL